MASRQATAHAPSATAMEQMRLVAQALEFEPQSRWLLDTIDTAPMLSSLVGMGKTSPRIGCSSGGWL